MSEKVVPYSLKDSPALIERIWPTGKISAEAQKERKANLGQTLTALGSYWKGRKPLILVKACVLGALLPATNDPEADLAVFEKLMAIDDESFLRRKWIPSCVQLVKRLHSIGWMSRNDASYLFTVRVRSEQDDGSKWTFEEFHVDDIESLGRGSGRFLEWSDDATEGDRHDWMVKYIQSHSYIDRVAAAKRPEQLEPGDLYEPIWAEVNSFLKTTANSIPELVEQLGIMRFGHCPKIADTFSGGGSIPFEAARNGCDVFASDLNPIGCMLTWGALNIIGADEELRSEIDLEQRRVTEKVDLEISQLGIEHDENGNRAKAFIYCLETRCPESGWLVPLIPSLIISKPRKAIARLIPDQANKRYDIQILSNVNAADFKTAKLGTVRKGRLIHPMNDNQLGIPISTIRGDYRDSEGNSKNRLRAWEKLDFIPRDDDIFQERLYCIQWIKKESLSNKRQETFLAAPTESDFERERKVEDHVRMKFRTWQEQGLVPDMPIEPGKETTRLLRERGWTYWHHLFNPRQLLIHAEYMQNSKHPITAFNCLKALDWNSRICHWIVDWEKTAATFYSQSLNTFFNYGNRAFAADQNSRVLDLKSFPIETSYTVQNIPAENIEEHQDIFITDPPYADAVNYHEIYDFFISWLRKNPPAPFDEWLWDSRSALAIKGEGQNFRSGMVRAYKAMASHMPDNGLQIVMFTHQSGRVWSDMALIFWGAGLQVIADWYIATETTSELKKGGYVQGTHIIVLRKRQGTFSGYSDEITQEVKSEVAEQIETMVGLNQTLKGHGRMENVFEDADLQMAGYAAALRILTKYTKIDGKDMTVEALRPREKTERTIVDEVVEFAVQVANEHLVPEGMNPKTWERCRSIERFYLKMLDIESVGVNKLDNYQNFAKAFRVPDYSVLMASMKPNKAYLKSANTFGKSQIGDEDEFGSSLTRAILFGLWEMSKETEDDVVLSHIRDFLPNYMEQRDDLQNIASYISLKRQSVEPDEARNARILTGLIKNERIG